MIELFAIYYHLLIVTGVIAAAVLGWVYICVAVGTAAIKFGELSRSLGNTSRAFRASLILGTCAVTAAAIASPYWTFLVIAQAVIVVVIWKLLAALFLRRSVSYRSSEQ